MRGIAVAVAALVLWGSLTALGQGTRPGRPDADRILPGLDEEAARQALEAFRQQRLRGDYTFDFELEHRPRRGEAVVYAGRMWGTWRRGDHRTRIHMDGDHGGARAGRLLVWAGPSPRYWEPDASGDTVELEGEALRAPLLPGIEYTPFDLAMPFAYWNNAAYVGKDAIANRPAYVFLLRPGPGQEGSADPRVKAVKLWLYADHNVLLRAQSLDGEGEPLKSFKVRSFQEVDGQYIVKRIDLVDERSRDKTRFEVRRAAVGIDLPAEIFEPEYLGLEVNTPPRGVLSPL